MKQCNACDRHLFGKEPVCPFCGADQPTTAALARGAMASVALAMTVGLTACGPTVDAESSEDGAAAESSSETSIPTTTTNSTTTVTTTPTEDGPAVTSIADSSSDDSADDLPGSFYAGRPDGGGPDECNLFTQADCPEGEKCMPWANDGGPVWNAVRCSPIAEAPGQEDDPCTVEAYPTSGIDDCDLGLMCFFVDIDTNMGTCIPLCGNSAEDPTCASMEQQCSITNDGVLPLCLDNCHPLMPVCSPGFGCYPLDDGFTCFPTEGGGGVYGDPCDFPTDCEVGHTCVDGSVLPGCPAGCCTPFCDLMAPDDCPDPGLGISCTPWFEMPPMGYEDVGVCVAAP